MVQTTLPIRNELFQRFLVLNWLGFREQFILNNLGTSSDVMLSEQTYTGEFKSHWVSHSFSQVLHLSKKLSKLLFLTICLVNLDPYNPSLLWCLIFTIGIFTTGSRICVGEMTPSNIFLCLLYLYSSPATNRMGHKVNFFQRSTASLKSEFSFS